MRRLAILIALVLVVAACGGGTETTATTTAETTASTAVDTTTPTSTTPTDGASTDGPTVARSFAGIPVEGGSPAIQAMLVSYDFEKAESHTYDYRLRFAMRTDILEAPEVSAEELAGLPGDTDIEMSMVGRQTITVGPGPEPGLYELTIANEIVGIEEISGTVDGEPIEGMDRALVAEEMASTAGVQDEVTVIVDERGNIVRASVDGEDVPIDMFGGDAGLFGQGFDPARMFGPPLPDEPIEVGSTWTHEESTPNPFGDPENPTEIRTVIESTVTGTAVVAGHEVFVIETVTRTDPVVMDMGAFLNGMAQAFAQDGDDTQEVPDLVFVIEVAPSDMRTTAYFDPVAEVLVGQETDGSVTMTMTMEGMPEMGEGRLVLQMTMDLGMEMVLAE